MILKNKIFGGTRSKGIFKNGSKIKPLITVVTVVLNGEKYLEEAILSIINQTYDNVEYIIIDGGSTDGTIDIIHKYEDLIDFWISEKDSGIYSAMNKGIALSRGDFVGFMGSNDYLYLNSLEKIARASEKNTIDYTVGPVDIIKENGELEEKILVLPNFLSNNRYIFDMASHHLSFYISRKIINDIKFFDENLKIRSDYDMTIKVISSSKNYFSFIDSIGAFRKGGISGSYKSYYENFLILKKHGVSIYKIILNILLSLIKVFVINNFPSSIIKLLREKFSSGRFIK